MTSRPKEIAAGVYWLPVGFSNVYFVRSGASWVLVDAAWASSVERIMRAAGSLFGENTRPAAILLTHIHPDHSGAVRTLARAWNVPVYAHPAELPLASGRLLPEYANPLDQRVIEPMLRLLSPPRIEAIVAQSSIADVTHAFDPEAAPPGLPDWESIHTPGHTPGHVAFFRRSDGVLLTGDACLTVNVRSPSDVLFNKQTVAAPPRSSTWDWQAATSSVATLARLEPRVLASGHGAPMCGPAVARALHTLATQIAGAGATQEEREAGVGEAQPSAPLARRLGLSMRSQAVRRSTALAIWQYHLTKGRSARLFGGPGEAILLTTRGRKTGRWRTVPLQAFRDDGDLIVVAANLGQAANPGWYYNLKATPWAQVERVGDTLLHVRAVELTANEAAVVWRRLAERAPAYARTQRQTSRIIPLMRLHPVTLTEERPAAPDQTERAEV